MARSNGKKDEPATRKVSQGASAVAEADPPDTDEGPEFIPDEIELDESQWEEFDDTKSIPGMYEDQDVIGQQKFDEVWSLIQGLPQTLLHGSTINIHRERPKKHRGVTCAGPLGPLTPPYTTDHIRREYGGGLMRVELDIRVRTHGGTRRNKQSATFWLPGLPKLEEEDESGDGKNNDALKLVLEQMKQMQEQINNRPPSFMESLVKNPQQIAAYVGLFTLVKETFKPAAPIVTPPPPAPKSAPAPDMFEQIKSKVAEIQEFQTMGKTLAKAVGLKMEDPNAASDPEADDVDDDDGPLSDISRGMKQAANIMENWKKMTGATEEQPAAASPAPAAAAEARISEDDEKMLKALNEIVPIIWDDIDKKLHATTTGKKILEKFKQEVPAALIPKLLGYITFDNAMNWIKAQADTPARLKYVEGQRCRSRVRNIIRVLNGQDADPDEEKGDE